MDSQKKSNLFFLLLVFEIMLVVLFASVCAFFIGYDKGYKKGYEDAIKEQKVKFIDMVVDEIVFLESSGRHDNVWGDKHTKHPAYGIAQFQERTFNWMKQLAGRPELQWKNKEDQLFLLRWAVENGYGHHWGNRYRKAVAKHVDMLKDCLLTSTCATISSGQI